MGSPLRTAFRDLVLHSQSGYACEALEPRTLLSGLTFIVHGYLPSHERFPGWVTKMSDVISVRIAEAQGDPSRADEVAKFRMRVTEPVPLLGPKVTGWNFSDEFQIGEGISSTAANFNLQDSLDAEAIIVLDWESLADFSGTTVDARSQDVADAAFRFLTVELGRLGEQFLAQPIHLIGHSRGASLIGALAEKLSQTGLWVDHVTSLDAHPVDPITFGVEDWGEEGMFTAGNVVFADSYWRPGYGGNDGPNGEPVAGAYNVQLDNEVLENVG